MVLSGSHTDGRASLMCDEYPLWSSTPDKDWTDHKQKLLKSSLVGHDNCRDRIYGFLSRTVGMAEGHWVARISASEARSASVLYELSQ